MCFESYNNPAICAIVVRHLQPDHYCFLLCLSTLHLLSSLLRTNTFSTRVTSAFEISVSPFYLFRSTYIFWILFDVAPFYTPRSPFLLPIFFMLRIFSPKQLQLLASDQSYNYPKFNSTTFSKLILYILNIFFKILPTSFQNFLRFYSLSHFPFFSYPLRTILSIYFVTFFSPYFEQFSDFFSARFAPPNVVSKT